uniref:phosphoribosylamine--glycine ligase n=1 Tax=Aestuariivirga sp. TaxID=2650926 RepID=UPI00359334EF
AAGKGVVVATTLAEAHEAIDWMLLDNKLGVTHNQGGARVVIEDFLEGEEASFIVLADGKNVVALATSQDHKRLHDHDQGPNTGGMGAYSPAPCMTPALCEEALESIVKPTIRALSDMGYPYVGVLYAGIILTTDGPKLIEYNCRFGDPECQVMMMRLKDDLVTLLLACCDGTLDKVSARWFDDVALTVVMCARGYPGEVLKGTEIRGLEGASAMEGVEIFHAGTARKNDAIVANGGRVLNVTARGRTVKEAQERAYAAVERIDWPEGFYRTDIGWRAIERENS